MDMHEESCPQIPVEHPNQFSLLNAVESGNAQYIQQVLAVDCGRWTERELFQAMLEAASLGHTTCIDALLKSACVHVNIMEEGCTPLLEAVKQGRRETVRFLLDKGANPNLASGYLKRSALLESTKRGHLDICDLLIRKGAECNQDDKAWVTPLMAAATDNKAAIVTLLLRSGALINGKDIHGESALFKAVNQGNLESTNILLKRGADCNFRAAERFGNTLLHVSAQRNDHTIVKALLQHGAHRDASNWVKQTPFNQALSQGHGEVVEEFLRAGVEFQEADRFGNTPIMKAAGYGFGGIVKQLVGYGASVNDTDVHMETALHKAIGAGSLECVSLLIPAGAQVDAAAYGGLTPLHVAAGLHCTPDAFQVLLLLLRRGSDVNKRGRHAHDAMWMALDNFFLPTARLLVEAGGSLNTLRYWLCEEILLDPAAPTTVFNNESLDSIAMIPIQIVKETYHWLWQVIQNPRSLQDLCLISIRQVLQKDIQTKVSRLPVPAPIQDKVNFANLFQLKDLFVSDVSLVSPGSRATHH